MLNPLANGKIQGLFNAFECFSSTFKANFIFKDFSRQSCIFKYFSSLCEPWESRKKSFLNFFYPLSLNIIYFVEKDKIFLRFCLCIFESDTVKSDCPMQIFRKIVKSKSVVKKSHKLTNKTRGPEGPEALT